MRRHGDHPVHVLPAGGRPRPRPDPRGDHRTASSGWRCSCRAWTRCGRSSGRRLTYADVYRESERQWSAYNYEHAPVGRPPAALRRARGRVRSAARAGVAAARLRPGAEGIARLQPARCAGCAVRRPSGQLLSAACETSRGRCVRRTSRRRPVPSLLLEIGCEELPSAAVYEAGRQLPSLALEHFGAEPDEVFLGPRRLAVLVRTSPGGDTQEWIQGPPLKRRGEGGRGVRAQARDHARGPRRARGSVGLDEAAATARGDDPGAVRRDPARPPVRQDDGVGGRRAAVPPSCALETRASGRQTHCRGELLQPSLSGAPREDHVT